MRHMRCWGSILMAISLGAGCADEERAADKLDEVNGEGPSGQSPPPLAKIEDKMGRVEWVAPDLKGDEPEVVITVRGEAAPLIHPDLVDELGTVQTYLALVDESAPIPASLAPFARDADRELAADPARRRALRARNQAARDAFKVSAAAEGNQDGLRFADSCTATQRNHARDTYGAAYSAGGGSSGSKTCGQTINFHSVSGTTYYCNIPGADCDYGLGGGTPATCDPPNTCGECDPNGCTTVRGLTEAFRLRWPTSAGDNGAGVSHYGVRYRFGFKNCSLEYSAVMRRRRGGGEWIYTTIEPNAMQIRTGGGAHPPPYALARDLVAWGIWEEHHNWGTSQDPLNQMEMTAATEGLMCGDIIQRFDTDDFTHISCNGGEALCDDNSCSGDFTETGCWD